MMRYFVCLFLLFAAMLLGTHCSTVPDPTPSDDTHTAMTTFFEDMMAAKWYPKAIDRQYGGFLSNLEYDWSPSSQQDKMIVTQARHLWSLSKLVELYPGKSEYREYADHGYRYLRDVMWDREAGGFHNLRTRDGKPVESSDYYREKRTYGNAFGLYALAAYARMSQSEEALELSKKAFRWIERFGYDAENKGYFQFLIPGGAPGDNGDPIPGTSDPARYPYKDQNTTIHLLEAYAELYRAWPNDTVRNKLNHLITLVRDTITTDKGTMNLFFHHDWRPVSFHDSTQRDYDLDHVSFGHDIETAFLLLDAMEALGDPVDPKTLSVAEKMVTHSLEYGVDRTTGGLFERGYYEDGNLVIIDSSKNWWSQAEAMNTLLLFDSIHPGQGYRREFDRLWEYVDTYFLDHRYGGWYEMGIDRDPEFRTGRKAHIWKGPYHTFRSMLRCMEYLERDVARDN